MKYCTKCGNELVDEAVVCPKCGCAAETKAIKKDEPSTLSTIAKIFMIISCVTVGWTLIPLAWCIPMTVSYCRKIKNKEPISVSFKVCTLIFVSTVSGILMLCDDDSL